MKIHVFSCSFNLAEKIRLRNKKGTTRIVINCSNLQQTLHLKKTFDQQLPVQDETESALGLGRGCEQRQKHGVKEGLQVLGCTVPGVSPGEHRGWSIRKTSCAGLGCRVVARMNGLLPT